MSRPALMTSLLVSILVSLALALGACGAPASGEKGRPAGAVSDTSAYRGAMAMADTTARMAALEAFLKNYPVSGFRAASYTRLYDLRAAQDPAGAAEFARSSLKTEKDPDSRGQLYWGLYNYARDKAPQTVSPLIEQVLADPAAGTDVYNSIGWDLVENKNLLDDAIRLTRVGVERAGQDSQTVSSTLDTEGWAQYVKGSYDEAVAALEKARAWSPQSNEEIDAHMASAYDAAGKKERARDLYKELLYSQEDPIMRSRVELLTKELGGSVQTVTQEIDQHRRDASYPAQDFTLNDYAGKPIHLSDFKGKVVLLNFWHPT
jgi:tetratricopeptide (TPR) repeat protein